MNKLEVIDVPFNACNEIGHECRIDVVLAGRCGPEPLIPRGIGVRE